MPGNHHLIEINGVIACNRSNMVHAKPDVCERAWPTSGGVIDRPVFDVPSCDASLGQSGCEAVHDVQIGNGEPTPSVDDNRHWMRTLPLRQA
jgi:hypothetical protein